jgi:hypothetical protein
MEPYTSIQTAPGEHGYGSIVVLAVEIDFGLVGSSRCQCVYPDPAACEKYRKNGYRIQDTPPCQDMSILLWSQYIENMSGVPGWAVSSGIPVDIPVY